MHELCESVNFFNITNYEEKDLASACDAAAEANADFVYFADTHGGLLAERLSAIHKRDQRNRNDTWAPPA